MNELTPTEIAFINQCNSLVRSIACVSENEQNYASVSFFGRVGGSGGTITFSLRDKLYSGEYEFRTREECVARLESVLAQARRHSRV